MSGLEKTMEELHLNPSKDKNELDFPPLNLIIQRFEGESIEGKPSGEGVACFEGGHMYKGMFSQGLMHGHGVFTWAGGLKYEGSFVSNSILGKGTYSWPDGSSYNGEVHQGLRHGTGTYHCAKTGGVYKGQWHQGKRQGQGIIYFNKDETSWYEGDWTQNRIEGSGLRQYVSGNTYSGEWRNNLRHGEGTMKWLLQGQRYEGTWQHGVQHGRGKQTWILSRDDASRFPQSNHFVGDFVFGQRHGTGTFYFADGAVYEGKWRNNRKHGHGKITFKNGKVFEGEFVDDQIVQLKNDGPLPPLALSSSSVLAPDMSLDIDDLLNIFPEQRRDRELKEVEFAVWKHGPELRSMYNFYSRLGLPPSDSDFTLSHLQLCRFLKDCELHHHHISLCQMDLLTADGASSAESHSPFSRILFRKLLTRLVFVAHHIYHKDIISQWNLLASCFFKLMTDDILPNAKHVKGFVFKQQECTDVVMEYCERSWNIYQTHRTMTCRDLLLMFKDLNLLDEHLSATKVMEVVSRESSDPGDTLSCLQLQMTFLEFLEALVGCAEVKGHFDSDQVIFNKPDSTEDEGRDKPEQEILNQFKTWEKTVRQFFHYFFNAFEQQQKL